MSYVGEFERAFMRHTLAIVRDYRGEFDATLLVNCLLGLLIVPKEDYLKAIPADPLDNLPNWGIQRSSIIAAGRVSPKSQVKVTNLRELVTSLRHAVAHFNVRPFPDHGEVRGFVYTNGIGLHARISLSEMREFVTRLAEHLERAA
jgi:hypothetical protein